MGPQASSAVLVGRSGQLAALEIALAGAARSHPSAVLVGGEAGVGKSRLVSEFAVRSRGAGARVLIGGCLELGADGLPFAPFTAVLRELVRDLGAAGVAGLLPGGSARELARLLPEFGEPAAPQDAGEARARLFEQMLILLEHLAGPGPVALVMEDMHWADRSTRDLLAFLIRNQAVRRRRADRCDLPVRRPAPHPPAAAAAGRTGPDRVGHADGAGQADPAGHRRACRPDHRPQAG